MDLSAQWQRSWSALGVAPSARLDALYQDLSRRYGEPHRHYHTLRHLEECFTRFEEIRRLTVQPAEAELAIWFHDVIYDPRRDDNEERSAAWVRARAMEFGVGADVTERVRRLVRVTQHLIQPSDIDAQAVVDVDLWILAAEKRRYAEYERQIRHEYGWMGESAYRRRRKRILERFINRSSIFRTAPFVQHYERRARSNLLDTLRMLER